MISSCEVKIYLVANVKIDANAASLANIRYMDINLMRRHFRFT
jgi:hypothetical protein